MTTFITKAQREWLIAEYMEQLEEFDQLDEYPGMEETFGKWATPNSSNFMFDHGLHPAKDS